MKGSLRTSGALNVLDKPIRGLRVFFQMDDDSISHNLVKGHFVNLNYARERDFPHRWMCGCPSAAQLV